MVKVISLSDDAYRKLKMIKGDRSFSNVVVDIVDERLSGSRRRKKEAFMKLAGAFKDNADHWEKMKKLFEEDRKKFKLREVKL
tara:strand:- start:114 stop:362 length:249 start_codon:yes stop_codon:yes gene_type:complete